MCVHIRNDTWMNFLWLLYVLQKHETSKNVIKVQKKKKCPWKVSLSHITHLKLRIFDWFPLAEHHNFIFNMHGLLFSQHQREINTDRIGGTTDSESNFFYFLYLFRYTTLRQHSIKKLYKIIIGKTISKSSVLANKPAEPLNLCSLQPFSLYITNIKLTQIRKAILAFLKALDAYSFVLRRKLRF